MCENNEYKVVFQLTDIRYAQGVPNSLPLYL